jgi:hypothetical protein
MSDTNKVRVKKKVIAALIEFDMLDYAMYVRCDKRLDKTSDINMMSDIFSWGFCNTGFWIDMYHYTHSGGSPTPSYKTAAEILKKHHERS